jgi:hypothetical protein
MTLKEKPPVTRRRFVSPWVELDYLCKKIHYWFYTRMKRSRAERYLDRLETVLADLPKNDVAIIRHEGFALLHELKGDVNKAIRFRRREIELIERLHEIARSPHHDDDTRAYMLQGHGAADLQDRRKILAALELRMNGTKKNGVLKKH